MEERILKALHQIPVSILTRAEWIQVGMALKEEGYPCNVWDEWSRDDSRYHAGECERQWNSFHGSDRPVTAGTIYYLAEKCGWDPADEAEADAGTMRRDTCANADWNAALPWGGELAEEDGGSTAPTTILTTDRTMGDWDPVLDFRTFINTLFKPEEYIGYVTGDVWKDADGKWFPKKGVLHRTAEELLDSLEQYPDDLGATVGDWKEEAGAWIRINPIDGKDVRNENVTRFDYALVESDTLPVREQEKLFRELELPIATLVHSGGKSLHAIVRVDAQNYEEYRKRVRFLYGYLEEKGIEIDRQNCNPSRLSRMPGVTRNGKRQYLVAVNIGKKSWADWVDFTEGETDELPELVSLSQYRRQPPDLPEELIEGILRKGHKMLISGSSKAGKSFLLMELCIAIAEGKEWLGFPCRKGRVLYVNLEIDPASAINRFLKIYEAMEMEPANADSVTIWNLRGHAVPLDKLVPVLIRRMRNRHFDAVVIDPIYKVITGDENNASDMGFFCNQFDRICSATGCSTIYCHHHSKGSQGQKRAMDRASGSGVFARDPDAQLDMIELELSEDLQNNVADHYATAWRMESSLREFANIEPVNFWFDYPVHRLDTEGFLSGLPAQGTAEAGRVRNPRSKRAEEAAEEFRTAYNVLNLDGKVTVKEMMEYMGLSDKTVYARIRKLGGEYFLENGCIHHREGDSVRMEESTDTLADHE